MKDTSFNLKSGGQLSPGSIGAWRFAQFAVWLIGIAILFCLLFSPALGILLFWNILIPVAPFLFVVGAGVWRNVCPLATTNLLPRHLGFSKKKRLSTTQLGKLNLISVVALYVIVPVRHAIFNRSGIATAIVIISMSFIGVILGFFYEWKSAWCSGLCPIHPVEKLYGGNVLMSIPNAHCDQCRNCVIPCPDSTPNIHPKSAKKTIWHQMSGLLITGGLPGFIWGWFHEPDETTAVALDSFLTVYKLPVIGFFVTLTIYIILAKIVPPKYERTLVSIFAAAGVSCYYWYRIPSLFGFGNYSNDGLLVNLTDSLPLWSISAITITTTIFFFYWLVLRKPSSNSWIIRPRYAKA